MSMRALLRFAVTAIAMLSAVVPASGAGDDGERLLTVDHYVTVKSTVPAIAGQAAEIYVREKVLAGPALRSTAPDRIVLFVHGAGTPAEVAFDVPYQDYSWMAYLARAGYDVFSMDTTGYGRSTRPSAMNDPCNLPGDRQVPFVKAPCAPTYAHALTTIQSDWDDVGAAVDYVRALRHVEKVSLIAWSLGGPRAGGYAGQHPDKVSKLVLLAPAYNRNVSAAPPAQMAAGAAFNTQSRDDFTVNWDRQVGCSDQYERATSDSVWTEMLASDPVGATWGSGVRRAPQTAVWGWTQAMAAKTMIPTLMVSGAHDKQVPQPRVQDLFADFGAAQKVFIDLACSSHNAMWEKNHLLLFRASLEWLNSTTVNGAKAGPMKLGY
jgi:pimeloyl-ACP methyl ester carboxylesterase